jgi:hypothetical protein
MPLQIRRGTETQRVDPSINLTLAEGELLWVTNDKRLYIGDGTTLAANLLPVTGFNAEDARDAAASLFTTATHSNVTFTYDDNSNTLSAAVNLSDYNGVITASSFNGSLVADDSTELVNAVDSKINLDGTIKGAVRPNTSASIDIGTSSFKFKDLYLSGNANITGNLVLGTGATISSSGSAINLPAGTTINGSPIGDASNGSTIAATFVGDITGSVFSDNSTLLIDGLTGQITNGSLSLIDNALSGSGNDTLIIENSVVGNESIEIKMLGDTGSAPTFVLSASHGTLESPSDQSSGDEILSMQFKGYAEGASKEAGGISAFWSSTADMTSATPDSNIVFATRNNTDGFKVFRFDERGVFNAPVIKATGYATGSLPTAGVTDEGFIVFDSTTKEFKGWNGTSWVVLG